MTPRRISLRDRLNDLHDLEVRLRAMDRALASLRDGDPELGRLMEYRLFAGMTLDWAARSMGLSPRVAEHHWKAATLRFLGGMEGEPRPGSR